MPEDEKPGTDPFGGIPTGPDLEAHGLSKFEVACKEFQAEIVKIRSDYTSAAIEADTINRILDLLEKFAPLLLGVIV